MEAEQQAIVRIEGALREIYCKTLGKEPDAEVLRAEAEEFVAKHGPTATMADLLV